MSLDLKYRPKNFKEFIGNDAVKNALKTILVRDIESIPHTFLFTGDTGCGKTTLARIMKVKMFCSDFDFHEYNSSNTRGIDTIRDISDKCKISPMDGDVKIYYLDEVHKITNDGQNALLKLLEEPPKFVYFILATTEPDKLLATVKSRCKIFDLKSLSDEEIILVLQRVLDGENKTISQKVFDCIVYNSGGSPRQAIKLLDTVIDMEGEKDILSVIEDGVEEKEIIDLCRILVKGDWRQISDTLKSLKVNTDYEKIRYAILGYFNSFLINSGNFFAAEVIDIFEKSFMYVGKAGLTLACFRTFELNKKRRTR